LPIPSLFYNNIENITFGHGAEIKTKAYEKALELVR
jgi:hypothetical protein